MHTLQTKMTGTGYSGHAVIYLDGDDLDGVVMKYFATSSIHKSGEFARGLMATLQATSLNVEQLVHFETHTATSWWISGDVCRDDNVLTMYFAEQNN